MDGDFEVEDGEILDDSGGGGGGGEHDEPRHGRDEEFDDLEDDLHLHQLHGCDGQAEEDDRDEELGSLTVTFDNLDHDLMQRRQESFEVCLSKFLESARKEAGINSESEHHHHVPPTNSHSVPSSFNGHRRRSVGHGQERRVRVNIINGNGGSQYRRVKTKFRRKKAKTWVRANFGGRESRSPNPTAQIHGHSAATPSLQSPTPRSPDDLRNKLNEMRSRRSSRHESPISPSRSQNHNHNSPLAVAVGNCSPISDNSFVEMDLPTRVDSSPELMQQQDDITEREIAETDADLELLIGETQLLKLRNDTVMTCKNLVSKMSTITECTSACLRLESSAVGLREELAKLKVSLLEGRQRIKMQGNGFHTAKDLLRRKKLEYLELQKECNRVRKLLGELGWKTPPSPILKFPASPQKTLAAAAAVPPPTPGPGPGLQKLVGILGAAPSTTQTSPTSTPRPKLGMAQYEEYKTPLFGSLLKY